MTVSSNVAPSMNMTPVSDLAFVAALAQAELDVINGTHEDNDNDDNGDCQDNDDDDESGGSDSCMEEDNNDEERDIGEDKDQDSESDSSSEGDDDDDDDVDRRMIPNSDEEDGGAAASTILRTKNEIVSEDVEPLSVELCEGEELSLVGEVISVVVNENTIVIQSITTTTPLDEGSVLCLGDRRVIGQISELFGPLSSPFYVVKHSAGGAARAQEKRSTAEVPSLSAAAEVNASSENETTDDTRSDADVEENVTMALNDQKVAIADVHPGTAVYVAMQHSSFVTPHSLSLIRNIRGSDASNMWDEEVCSWSRVE
jgi:H/ACA ribonucleoprotein complex non-core subunit NAF1